MEIPEGEGPDGTEEERRRMMRRIFRISVGAYVVFALYVGPWRGLWPLFALTCSALVAMINFLWLETILVKFSGRRRG